MSAVLNRWRPPKHGAPLSPRERDVLTLLPLGKTNAEIAGVLGTSPLTIKNHVQNLLSKLGASNRIIAVGIARQLGLVDDQRLPAPDMPRHDPVAMVSLGEEAVVSAPGMQLFTDGTLTVNGRSVHLARKEFDLLRFFATHLGRTYTREQLLDCVWGPDVAIEQRTVDCHIKKLRLAMPADCPYDIETIKCFGYRMVAR